jgi:hypothetical protein
MIDALGVFTLLSPEPSARHNDRGAHFAYKLAQVQPFPSAPTLNSSYICACMYMAVGIKMERLDK